MHWTTWLAVSGLTAIGLTGAGCAVVERAPAPPAPPAPPISSYNDASPAISIANGLSCDKPGAMGISRIVEITTIGGLGFGAEEHFNGPELLRDNEVVLTFDDGPRVGGTEPILKALDDQCLKATFFEIGQNAMAHSDLTRAVIAAGMTVGTHTWSHKNLAGLAHNKALEQIERGISAVTTAADGPIAPFFRFPYLQHTQRLVDYLGQRNIATMSADIDARDFKMHTPAPVVESVISQLKQRGKGIVLLHDLHTNTAEAMPELLRQLKLDGYKIVHIVPKGALTTLAKYDDIVRHRKSP
jgi:peptidoglycan/xylan/chitin deacetylase (PgdA/CDA1 family)